LILQWGNLKKKDTTYLLNHSTQQATLGATGTKILLETFYMIPFFCGTPHEYPEERSTLDLWNRAGYYDHASQYKTTLLVHKEGARWFCL